MEEPLKPQTAELLALIHEKIQEAIRERNTLKYIHLDSKERGIIASEIERVAGSGGKVIYQVMGYEIRPGDGGVFVSG